jgi:LacI family transcriptional regulator
VASSQARLSDVAAAAGIAVSTASKILNGTGRASEATRKRVFEAADRLDFRPNALARSFALGRSYTVGILADKARETFSMPVLIGANEELSKYDMASLTYSADDDPALRAEHVRRLRARRVDGLLVIGSSTDVRYASVSANFPAPTVYAFGRSESDADASFLPEDYRAGLLAVEHLVGLGRTSIAHITGERTAPAVIERSRGFLDALGAAHLQPAFGAPLFGDYFREWGYRAAQQILDRDTRIDGLFAGNDEIGLGAYAAFHAAGLRIPEDIAIVGYDNFSRITGVQQGFLTTIDPNLADVGAAAVDHLLAGIDGAVEPGVFTVPCTLIPGSSTIGRSGRDAPIEVVLAL